MERIWEEYKNRRRTMLIKYVRDIENEPVLNVEQTYVVLAIGTREDGCLSYVIKRNLEHWCYGFYNIDCFEIISPKIPDCWIFTKDEYGIILLPKEWNFKDFWEKYDDYEKEVYNMAERYVKKMILDELPMEEFERALKPKPYEDVEYTSVLEYILEMITEGTDERFVKHIIEVAKWYKFYPFYKMDKDGYRYKNEIGIFEQVYKYLSLFWDNSDAEEYLIDFLVNDDNEYPNITKIINESFKEKK